MKESLCAMALGLTLPITANASEDFIAANTLGIFYHELAHAIIDIEGVPIFGQEEDAADVFSILLVDALFEADTAVTLAYDIADGFWAEALEREEDEEPAWWDTHGPDEQRFYNTVCLFYGANPETREGFAEDMELPEDRAETCPDEYDQAISAWGAVLDEMEGRGGGETLKFDGGDGSLSAEILSDEIKELNATMSLAQPVTIRMESCGEANAFYDPGATEIIYCTEFEDHLERIAP